jgi:hypothetical protein
LACSNRFGEIGYNAAMDVPHLQGNAASANSRMGNGGKVRIVQIHVRSSECRRAD